MGYRPSYSTLEHLRWKDSLRNVRRVTHSVHAWDNGKHAHERTNDFAAHLALFRRRLEVGVLEQDLRARPLPLGSALGHGVWLHSHVVSRRRRLGLHFFVFTATRFRDLCLQDGELWTNYTRVRRDRVPW